MAHLEQLFSSCEVKLESPIASENSVYGLRPNQTKSFMSFVLLAISVWCVCLCVYLGLPLVTGLTQS